MSDYFPPDLVVEILLKLPVKSLMRFTAVCKSWQSVITSPFFISSHLHKPRNETLLLKHCDTRDKQDQFSLLEINSGPFCINSSSELELPFKSQLGNFRVVGSCRGILCLSDENFSCLNRPVLWNPSVKQHLVLPYGGIDLIEPDDCVLGFGAADNDFKVVRLVYFRRSDSCGYSSVPEAEVFSLRTGKWRRLIGIDVEFKVVKFMWSQVFLNGVVHWLGHYRLNNDRWRCAVLGFRVGEEVFFEITLPYELAKEPVTNLSLTFVGKSLAVIRYNRDLRGGSCDVWVMKEYGVESSWTKWYSSLLVEGMERVLALRKNGEALVASRKFGLVAFDLANRKIRSLGIHGKTLSFCVDNYVESLELLKFEYKKICEEVEGAEEDLI